MDTESSAGPRRYLMRERLFDIGEDLTVLDEAGRPAFRVDGKILTLRKTFVLEDLEGRALATVRRPLLALVDTVVIERPGQPDAKVRHRVLSLLRKQYRVELPGEDLEVEGDIIGHEYTIRRGSEVAARISKSWFRVREAYGIEVEAGEDPALMIAIGVALEEFDRGE
jgi:uncharacterized protein YxjI